MFAGVVIRLTSTMSSSHSMPAGRLVVVARALVLAVRVAFVLVAAGLGDEVRRQQLHPAVRAVAGLLR